MVRLLRNGYSQRIEQSCLSTLPLVDDISGKKRLIVHYLFGLLTKLITRSNSIGLSRAVNPILLKHFSRNR